MKISKDELLDVITEASHRLHHEMLSAYRLGTLENFMNQIGMEDLLPQLEEEAIFESYSNGKVLIVGATKLKKQQILGVFDSMNIAKERVELILDYDDAKKYKYSKLQYNPRYRLILFGPVPHSTKDKDESASIISKIENGDGYPKVIELSDGHKLNISKTNLRNALIEEISNGYLEIS